MTTKDALGWLVVAAVVAFILGAYVAETAHKSDPAPTTTTTAEPYCDGDSLVVPGTGVVQWSDRCETPPEHAPEGTGPNTGTARGEAVSDDRAAFIVDAIPEPHGQWQASLSAQLDMLHLAGTRLGLYDAVDWLHIRRHQGAHEPTWVTSGTERCEATCLISDERWGGFSDRCDRILGHDGVHASRRQACEPEAWFGWPDVTPSPTIHESRDEQGERDG